MDALNHADQMRLANLINDNNSDDAELQKKLDQVVELTNSTRDQAAIALYDCHYDVEKAVDMILEGDHVIVENQWKSAGKKKNKNVNSQANKQAAAAAAAAAASQGSNHHHASAAAGSTRNVDGKNANNRNTSHHHQQQQQQNKGTNHHQITGAAGHHHHQQQHHTPSVSTNQQSTVANTTASQNSNNNYSKLDASDKNSTGLTSSNLIPSSDLSTTTSATTSATTAAGTQTANKVTSLQQQQQPAQHQQQHLRSHPQRGAQTQLGNRAQHHSRSTRIPDSAVEMPNSELQVSALNVQFGELDLRDASGAGSVSQQDQAKGAFQDVLETNRLGRQSGLPNSHPTIPSQDNKNNRQFSQQTQHLGKSGPRRPYYNADDRRFNNNTSNSYRGGRQISGNNQRPYNHRQGPMNSNNNPRGGGNVRTIINRGLQPNPNLNNNANQPSDGFPDSIDTWTNSTAEAATKPTNSDQSVGVGNTLRVGQWSDVAGTEDWSEEDWEAKVMETKVFTPSSKAVDGPATNQKNQPLLNDASVPSQINLATKLSDTVSSQSSTLNAVNQPVQSQQSSQKPIPQNFFDPSMAEAVLKQSVASMKPKTSMSMSQYSKEASEARAVLEQQNLSSMKPKTTMSMNQYNKEASESLKSLVGISSSNKAGVPSVPPGALPLMSQPQYIMGNAYQPAIFPYPYQTPDVHYQVAAQTAGRDQNFQSVYSPSDANKFNRGADGDAPSITTTQAAPVASQTHNQAFVTNALHTGYQLTYAMPGAFNMMPQNLYSAAPIFPHIPQPTNTGSANSVYQKNTAASYHTGYSGYDASNPVLQDYVKQLQQQQQQQNYSGSNMQPTSKASGVSNELDVTSGGSSYNMYGSVNKGQQQQANKQPNYNDAKGYQQQMSGNGPQQQFGFSHNAQQPTSIAGYPLLQHNLDGLNLNQQHSGGQRGGSQMNPSKYYPNWN